MKNLRVYVLKFSSFAKTGGSNFFSSLFFSLLFFAKSSEASNKGCETPFDGFFKCCIRRSERRNGTSLFLRSHLAFRLHFYRVARADCLHGTLSGAAAGEVPGVSAGEALPRQGVGKTKGIQVHRRKYRKRAVGCCCCFVVGPIFLPAAIAKLCWDDQVKLEFWGYLEAEQKHTLFNDLRRKLAKRSKEFVNLMIFLLSSKKNYCKPWL